MRRLLSLTVGLLALSSSGSLAADIPRPATSPKAPAMISAYDWTGGYIGISGGYGWGGSTWSSFGTNAKPSGGIVGLTGGYNWQDTSRFVFGIESDISWSDMGGQFANASCPTGCETKNSWLGTVRGRAGYAVDRVMPYFTGGLAFGDVEATRAGFGSASDTGVGWTVGAGIESVIGGNWTAKVEYLYVDLGSFSCAICSAARVDFHSNVVRAGINFRF